MDALRALILSLCDSDRRGGRVQLMGERSLRLVDCMHWDSSWTSVLTTQYPELEISIQSHRTSLSGFAVCFKLPAPRRELLWHAVIALILACCLYALYHGLWSGRRADWNRI